MSNISTTPNANARVIAYGEALIDMIAQVDGSYLPVVGGSPLNTAVALARQGIKAAIVTPVSSDGFGELIRDHMRKSGVDDDLLIVTDAPTTLAIATLDETGQAQYRFYIDGCSQGQWSLDHLKDGPKDGDIFTVSGSFALSSQPMADVFETLFKIGSKYHTVFFDPNIRQSVIGDKNTDVLEAQSRFDRWVALADVVKASDEDIRWRYPDGENEDIARTMLDSGPELVVITGSDWVYSATKEFGFWTPTKEIEVVDTVGAGDTFNAGLIKSLIERGRVTPDSIASISESELHDVIIESIDLAAQVCQVAGANPPWGPGREPTTQLGPTLGH